MGKGGTGTQAAKTSFPCNEIHKSRVRETRAREVNGPSLSVASHCLDLIFFFKTIIKKKDYVNLFLIELSFFESRVCMEN